MTKGSQLVCPGPLASQGHAEVNSTFRGIWGWGPILQCRAPRRHLGGGTGCTQARATESGSDTGCPRLYPKLFVQMERSDSEGYLEELSRPHLLDAK